MILRLLVLDRDLSHGPIYKLEQEGFELNVTKLEREEVFDGIYYGVSRRGLQLARHAEDYDAVIIGNNMGSGLRYAREIPDSMKDRTLIVWNEYIPDEERPYAAIGFEHFESRQQETDWLLQQAKEVTARAEA